LYGLLCAVFGLACHVGLQLGLPSVGVAKTLYHVDGIENGEEHRQKVCNFTASFFWHCVYHFDIKLQMKLFP